MKKRFLLLSGVLLGLALYTIQSSLIAIGGQEEQEVGLYCERRESGSSKVSSAMRRAANMGNQHNLMKEAAQLQKEIVAARQQGRNVGEFEARLKTLRAQLAKVQPAGRATEIPNLPRPIGSLPHQRTVDGQDYTCAFFNAEAGSKDGWVLKRQNGNFTLELDSNKYHGLDRDQFVANPGADNRTATKASSELKGGKRLYRSPVTKRKFTQPAMPATL